MVAMAATTIKVSHTTGKRLAAHRSHPDQPYDAVINRALDMLDEQDIDLSADFKHKLAAGRRAAKHGRVSSSVELLSDLGFRAPYERPRD